VERVGGRRASRVQRRLGQRPGAGRRRAVQCSRARERGHHAAPGRAHAQVLHQRAHQVARLAVPARSAPRHLERGPRGVQQHCQSMRHADRAATMRPSAGTMLRHDARARRYYKLAAGLTLAWRPWRRARAGAAPAAAEQAQDDLLAPVGRAGALLGRHGVQRLEHAARRQRRGRLQHPLRRASAPRSSACSARICKHAVHAARPNRLGASAWGMQRTLLGGSHLPHLLWSCTRAIGSMAWGCAGFQRIRG